MAAAGTSFLDIWLYGDFREKRPAGEVSPTMPYFSPGPWVTQPGERLLINSCFLFFFYSSLFPPPSSFLFLSCSHPLLKLTCKSCTQRLQSCKCGLLLIK